MLLEHFWSAQKCDQTWTLGPGIYYQNNATNTRTYGNVLDVIFISENLEVWKLWRVCVPNFLNFQNLECWTFRISKYDHVEVLAFRTLGIMNYGFRKKKKGVVWILNLKNRNSETLGNMLNLIFIFCYSGSKSRADLLFFG